MGDIILFQKKGKHRNTKGEDMYKELITSIRKKSNNISDMPERAKDVIKYFDIKYEQGGVPIIEILSRLGFKVYQQELQPSSLSAYIAVDPKLQERYGTNRITCVNCNDNIGHKRFALAHELAHYLFDFDENSVVYYNTYLANEGEQNEIEQRANAFAANLLMPEDEFRKVLNSCNEEMKADKISYLSDYFQVSVTAVMKRIGELKIEGYDC